MSDLAHPHDEGEPEGIVDRRPRVNAWWAMALVWLLVIVVAVFPFPWGW